MLFRSHEEAMKWLDKQDGKQPFFGIFTYTLPHAELAQPEDSILTGYQKNLRAAPALHEEMCIRDRSMLCSDNLFHLFHNIRMSGSDIMVFMNICSCLLYTS